MQLAIDGKVALVTAASKGLGRGAARALAAEGARVVICARGEAALRATEDELRAGGADVLALPVDVTRPEAPAQLAASAVDRFGGLDILVANAGGPPPGRALEVDDGALHAALEANLLTSIRLVRAAVPHMRATGWGRICLITSVTVKQPMPVLSLSNTARTGLWAWAKTAAADLFADGITLNLACPGLHATERVTQLSSGPGAGAGAGQPGPGPLGDPDDFGRVVAFLCSQPAGFISGTAVSVDGAATLGLL